MIILKLCINLARIHESKNATPSLDWEGVSLGFSSGVRVCNAIQNMVRYLILSIPIQQNSPDPAPEEVDNIKQWSIVNRMSLNLTKTWETVMKGKTRKQIPEKIPEIERKSELKLLGVTFSSNPCNWDTHIDSLLHRAASRLYILRVCKFYGYSDHELTSLFDSLIMSLFLYAIRGMGMCISR